MALVIGMSGRPPPLEKRTVIGTATWSEIFAAGSWISDTQYYAQARMVDKAQDVSGTSNGNQTSVFTEGQNLVGFIVDNTPPVFKSIG